LGGNNPMAISALAHLPRPGSCVFAPPGSLQHALLS
jgi:hypothetical protein